MAKRKRPLKTGLQSNTRVLERVSTGEGHPTNRGGKKMLGMKLSAAKMGLTPCRMNEE